MAADNDAMRVTGSRADKSTSVSELLAYAHAETGQGDNGIVNSSEAARILSRIARRADVNARIKALESLAKLDSRTGGDIDTSKLFPSAQLYFNILSDCVDGQCSMEFWPIVWMEMVLRDWWSPLIRIMVPHCKQYQPQLWARARNKLPKLGDQRDRPKKVEDGPVLNAAEIHELCRKNLMPLLKYLDAATDPDPREAAEEALIKAGLMEPALNAA